MRHLCRFVGLAIVALAAVAVSAQSRPQSQQLHEGLRLLETKGDPQAAIRVLKQAASGPDRSVSARARLYIGMALEKLGRDDARREYESIVREFSEQADVASEARRRLASLGRPVRTSGPAPPTLRRAVLDRIPGLGWYGSVSRDGRVLAYGESDRRAISLADTSSGQRIRTVAGPDEAIEVGAAVPSPDGRSVAYLRSIDKGTELQVSRPGEPALVLLRLASGDTVASIEWVVADRVLVQVVRADLSASLQIVAVPSGAVQQVAELTVPASRAALSPDGRFVTYDAPGDAGGVGRDLFVVDVKSGAVQRLVDDAFDDAQPVWTRQGDRVLFISDRTGAPGLWGIPMSEGRASGRAALLQADLGAVVLVWGVTDEGTYHYLRQTGLVDVYMTTLGSDGRSSGEPRGAAGTFIGFNLGPAFSPDGRVLAFAQMRQMGKSSREALGLRDVEQGTSRVVQTDMTLLRLPRWSPDGGRLLVKGSDKAGRFGFHLIDPTNGRSTPAVIVPPDQETTIGAARWVPDGGGILYSRRSREGEAIIRRDLGSGDERVVYRYEPGGARSFDVGRDGRLAIVQGGVSGSSLVISDGDTPPREIKRFPAGDQISDIAWMPDGRELLFVRRRDAEPAGSPGAEPGIWRIAAHGGEARPIGIQMPGLRALAVSPDGQSIAFTAGEPLREPWVLEHFLPSNPSSRARR